jgi:glycosyltransferase involved in cell wall biosynthesis
MKPRRILVITYWQFADALIQTYTLPYVRLIRDQLPEGSTISLLTLERENASPGEKQIEKGITHFSFSLFPFGLKAATGWLKNISWLKKFIRRNGIDTIHTWCTPAGGIGWWLSKRTGVPLVVDSFEPHAEPMVETGIWKKGGIAYRLLFFLEKKQVNHARYVVSTVEEMREYAAKKYGYRGLNFFAKPACIDFSVFNLSRKKNPGLLKKFNFEGKQVCVYAGKSGGLYATDRMFSFFAEAYKSWGDRFRILLLTSTPREEIDRQCAAHSVPREICVSVFVPHAEIADYMGLADFAYSAIIPTPSRRYCMPIKDGEYWACGLPVIIPPGISDDSAIIEQEGTGYVFKGEPDGAEWQPCIRQIEKLLEENKDGSVSARIFRQAEKYRNFSIAKEIYRKIYGS